MDCPYSWSSNKTNVSNGLHCPMPLIWEQWLSFSIKEKKRCTLPFLWYTLEGNNFLHSCLPLYLLLYKTLLSDLPWSCIFHLFPSEDSKLLKTRVLPYIIFPLCSSTEVQKSLWDHLDISTCCWESRYALVARPEERPDGLTSVPLSSTLSIISPLAVHCSPLIASVVWEIFQRNKTNKLQ